MKTQIYKKYVNETATEQYKKRQVEVSKMFTEKLKLLDFFKIICSKIKVTY